MDRLRRVAKALAAGVLPEAVDATWLVSAVCEYEAQAEDGMKLDRALGLVSAPGQEAWWTAERRIRRDASIRRLCESSYSSLNITEAAAEIEKAARRYHSSAWRIDREKPAHAAPSDEGKRFLAEAFRTGLAFPKARRIEDILRNEI
jgi:hypothetical protein